MTSRPPERRRPPQAIPMRGAPTPTDQPEPERSRNAGFVRPADVRAQESMSLAERRRQRRLQKAVGDNTLPPIAVPRNLPIRVYVSMRWFSAMITIALLAVLYLFLSRDMFFIHEIYVGGTRYLTPPEIFERSGLANMHIFWVDPAEVESKLKRDPAIADANVEVGWPPNMIQITITEREPALIWEQAGQRVWVDVRGRVMALRLDIPDLVRVVVEKPSKEIHLGPCSLQGMNEVLGPSSCIDPDIVAGVIQFKALYPNVTEMVYDPNKGLGYHDGRGWVLWFGNGIDIVTKMAVYQKIVESLLGRGITPIEVDVSNPDAPYYSAGVTKR